jgi:hypothetical protein
MLLATDHNKTTAQCESDELHEVNPTLFYGSIHSFIMFYLTSTVQYNIYS